VDVLLVSLTDRMDEMRDLVSSAGYTILGEVVQHKPMDPRTFVGKGKLEELKQIVQEMSLGAVVFHGDIRPKQHYNLEKELGVQVFDRTRVILEIFVQRAQIHEAKLQVELAMLHYEVPILKEWIHHGVTGERPGFMAGGEYRVDAYYETVKRRIKKIRDELEGVRTERERRRERRQHIGFHLVSIAGYANAGKSSLLNALTGAHVLVDARMFSTLQTTTRAVPGHRQRVLLTDTVGFISEVPLWLIEAFHTTLEEIYESDLILLVLDGGEHEEEFVRKLRLAARTLLPRASPANILPVISKGDRMTQADLARCTAILETSEFTHPPIVVSSTTGDGMDALRLAIAERFRFPLLLEIAVRQDPEGAGFLSWLHDRTEVESIDHVGGQVRVRLRCRTEDLGRIQERAAEVLVVPEITGDRVPSSSGSS